jgi:hypothetical protein
VYIYIAIDGRLIYRAIYGVMLTAIILLLFAFESRGERDWFKKLKNKNIIFSFVSIASSLTIAVIAIPYSISGNLHLESKKIISPKDSKIMSQYVQYNPSMKFIFTKNSISDS